MAGQAEFPPIPEPFPDALESVARHVLQVGGVTAGSRRAYNFVVGAGITISAVDDPVNEKIDVTFTPTNFTTGDVKESLQSASHGNWLLCDGGTFSGATWPNLQTLLGGTTLPDLRGRAPIGSGTGVGLTTRALKTTGGAETHPLVLAELTSHVHDMSHNHTQNSHNHTQNSHNHTQNSHNHTQNAHDHPAKRGDFAELTSGLGLGTGASGSDFLQDNRTDTTTATNIAQTATNIAQTATNIAETATNIAVSGNTGPAGSGTAHNNMQPFYVVNFFIYAA